MAAGHREVCTPHSAIPTSLHIFCVFMHDPGRGIIRRAKRALLAREPGQAFGYQDLECDSASTCYYPVHVARETV